MGNKAMTQDELQARTLVLTQEQAIILLNALNGYIANVPVCIISPEVNRLLRELGQMMPFD